MLPITIPDMTDKWDPYKKEFVNVKGTKLILEHSLVSIQKWESKWHISYISTEDKTTEMVFDYIKCMIVQPKEIDDETLNYIPKEEIKKIIDYIHDPMTATTFSDTKKHNNKKEIITAEVIYGWMIALNIPNEYRKWHINQLLTLIHVCEINNTPQDKMSRNEILARNKALNAQRKARLHTHG